MKSLKTAIIFLLFPVFLSQAQTQSVSKFEKFRTKMRSTPWIFGHGWNIVHDDAGKWFKDLFNTRNTWNATPFPLRFTWEKPLGDSLSKARGWSLEFMTAYNRYGKGNYLVDQTPVILVTENYTLLSFDLHGKYDFNHLVNLNRIMGSTKDIFQPYGTFGFGYTYRTLPTREHSATFNVGLGFNVWIYKGLGVQIQSLAKFGLANKFPHAGTNYLQHSAGVVYKRTPRVKTADDAFRKEKFIKDLKKTPWIVGLGYNVVHDDAGKWFKNLFNTDKAWNVAPYSLRGTCEKVLRKNDSASKFKGWSLEFMAAYNRYGKENYLVDQTPVILVKENYTLLSFDLHMKYDFNRLVNLNKVLGSTKDIFQPYGTFGFGYTYRTLPNREHSATFNVGLGFNVWMYKGLGIQVQSIAKFGLADRFPHAGTNYLQHSAGLVYKITPKEETPEDAYKKEKFRDDLRETPWIVGLGYNIVHDDAGKWFKNLFNTDKAWNIAPYALRVTCEKVLSKNDSLSKFKGWSVEFMAAYNQYGIGNYLVDQTPEILVPKNYSLMSFDLHLKYDFNQLVNLNKLIGGSNAKDIFQPYGTFGLGYTNRSLPTHPNSATANLGLGFNVWVYKGFGVQVQSIAKFGLEDRFPHAGTNYLQHSASIVYKIAIKPKSSGNRYKFKKHNIKKVL